MERHLYGRVAAALIFVLAFSTVIAAPPSIADFARQETIRDPRISPDGRYIAFISSIQGELTAVTLDLQESGKLTPVLRGEAGSNLQLTWCRWANNTRLVCGFRASINGPGGFTYLRTKMGAVDADGKNVKELMRHQSVSDAQFRDEVLDWTPDDPETVLVQANLNQGVTGTFLGSNDRTPAVFKLNVYTGALSLHMRPHPSIWDYRTDGNGNVRLGVGLVGDKRLYYARLVDDDNWRLLAKVEAFAEGNDFIPQHVVPGTNRAYAWATVDNRRALWEIDLADEQPPKLVVEHPLVDIANYVYSVQTGRLLGYWYETDRPFMQFVDEKLATVMRGINRTYPTTFNRPVSFPEDQSKIIVRVSSDVDPGTYLLYDANARQLKQLGRAYPELQSESLARMQPIEYPAQDGTMIPGYVMAPPGMRLERLPFIVLPHGGPAQRDSWQFDFLAQFLASRGYGVLKMNFRGSSGYGRNWFYAAHQDWGGLTYSDIIDGTRWIVDQGMADPNRICIVGWSFGGYAALLGAVRHSDLFRCSASIAGISKLDELISYRQAFVNKDIVKKQIGTDRDKLKNDSPARHAANVKIPVLLIHGTHDAQAPYEQSRFMAAALKSAKRPHEFVTIEDADHSLWRPKERELMLKKLEAFLGKHLAEGARASE